MNEAFLVCWSEVNLNLHRLPTEGIWNQDAEPLQSIELPRPTRTARFNHPESGGRLDEALNSLFREVDIALPVWMLLPDNWISHYRIKVEDLNPPSLTDQFIKWEVLQRLHGEHSEYRLLAPTDYAPGDVEVYVIKNRLLDFFSNALEKTGIEFSGIGIEPRNGEPYSFELPCDLRDAVQFKSESEVPIQIKKSIPPAAGIAVIVIAIAGASGWYLLGSKPESSQPAPSAKIIKSAEKTAPVKEITPAPLQDTTIAVKKVEPVAKQAAATAVSPAVKPTPSSVKTSTPVSANSPFSQFIKSLPRGSHIELAVISPVDFRVEITGLTHPDQWLSGLKKSPQFKSAELADKYKRKKENITIFHLANTGLSASNKPMDGKGWIQRAKQAGLQAESRRAWGDYEHAVGFVDVLWSDLSGFSKIYFAPENNYWVVTVQ